MTTRKCKIPNEAHILGPHYNLLASTDLKHSYPLHHLMLTMILQSRHVKAKLTMAQRSGELAQVTPPSSPASSRAPQGSRTLPTRCGKNRRSGWTRPAGGVSHHSVNHPKSNLSIRCSLTSRPRGTVPEAGLGTPSPGSCPHARHHDALATISRCWLSPPRA